MGVQICTIVDQTSPVAPVRLFKALCLDYHNCMPKVVPHLIKSVDILEGEPSAVGCVKQINFGEGGRSKYVKCRVDEIDVSKCYAKYKYFEGQDFNGKVEYFVHEAKIEALGTGSHYKVKFWYYTKGEAQVTEEEMKFSQVGMTNSLKAIERYLLDNPVVYAELKPVD